MLSMGNLLTAGAVIVATSASIASAQTRPTTVPTTTQPATTQPVESKAEQAFRQGSDALFLGAYDKAINLLEQAAAADPSKTSYKVHLARAYRYAGKEDKASATLEEILKFTPDHVEAGQSLAELYAQREDWKRVVEVLEPLLKFRHDYPSHHLLAQAKYALDDLPAARRYFEEAVRLNPGSAADRYDLGNIYLAGNFFALAAESYQAALSLGLQSPVLHYKLSSAYFNLRNYFGTIAVATVKSGKPGTISGDWYLIEPVPGQPERFHVAGPASAAFQVAKAMADGIGDQPDIRFLQANIYLNAGRFAQASAMLKEIEPRIPKEDRALFYFYHAQSAFGTGDYEGYLKHLKQAIELDGAAYGATLVDAYAKVAEEYNQAGDLEQYARHLKLAVEQNPQSAPLHLQLGNAYQEAERFAEAVTQWRMVLDLEPDHPRRLELLNGIAKFAARPTTGPATRSTTKPATQATTKPATQQAG